MFSRYLTTFALLLTFSSYAHAHTGMTPALGVTGAFTRADVQRPSAATECGSSINVAKSIDASTPVVAGADGTFTVNVTNFNPYVSFPLPDVLC
jgi:hypothetical protein